MGGKGSGPRGDKYTPGLSSREIALLKLLANGKKMFEIADEIGIGRSAYSYRMREIKSKLNARTNMHAIAIALREKWIK